MRSPSLMHSALFLEEILHVIFVHCYPKPLFTSLAEQGHSAPDLVALATTCRVFKEPALDVLWAELKDITPLARCLPGVSFLKDPMSGRPIYSFTRRLKETERETVKRYTRRVRALSVVYPNFDPESLADLCLPSVTDPLFPNIRRLLFFITDQTLPLVHHIVAPELRWLFLHFGVSNVSSCESLVQSLGPSCPSLKIVQITSISTPVSLDRIMNRHTRRWTHLQEVDYSKFSLDIDTFFHLSRMPGLTALSFKLNHELINQIASSNHLLVFSALQKLRITIGSIVPISKLFTHMQLPAISAISASFDDTSPPRHVIRSFLMALQKACTGRAAMHLIISHISLVTLVNQNLEYSVLTLEDIRYFTALNLTSIYIDLDWIVDLKDSDLLEIASLCQRLVSLSINENYGWRAAGITLAGLSQFLQRCPSIHQLCIALDTRGYASPPQIRTCGGNPVSNLKALDVVDSVIEAESVPALASFFADIFSLPAYGSFFFKCWGGLMMHHHHRDWRVYKERWQDVCTLAKQMVLERSERSAG